MSIRLIFVLMLVIGQLGVGICEIPNRNWRLVCIGILFAVCNTLIFCGTDGAK